MSTTSEAGAAPPPAPPQGTLYLVDGSGFIHRAYHALPKLSTRAGVPTGAVYGFTQMLIKLEQDHHPTHLAVVLDAGGEGFRDRLFAGYKANREAAPADLQPQFQLVRQVTAVLGLPLIEQPGVEADDLIATLARRAVEAGQRVAIVSSDKDLMQLLSEQVRMVRPVMTGPRGTMEDVPMGPEEVVARYGVPPALLGDVLALMGDSIDNVPGVPGVGEKTASALIRYFGGLSSMLDRLDEVPQVPGLRGAAKVAGLLSQHADQARLSRRLVALDDHLDVALELQSLRRREPDMGRVEALFRELEFERLLERLRPQGQAGQAGQAAAAAPAHAPSAQVEMPSVMTDPAAPRITLRDRPPRLATTAAEVAALVAELGASGEIAVSLECTGSGPFAPLVGVALAADGVEPAYVPLGHRYLGAPVQLSPEQARALLGPLLGDPAVRKLVHGAKEARLACLTADLPLAGVAFDPDLAEYLIDPARTDERLRQKPLGPIVARLGANLPVEERDDLLGKGKRSSVYEGVEVERAAGYAARRAEAVLRVSRLLAPELSRRGADRLLHQIELPLSAVLADIERHGIRVDTAHLGALGEEMGRRMAAIEAEVQQVAGYEVNLGSPRQLQELLFERLRLPATRKTKTGYSTDAEVLEELAELHPVAARILEHRQLAKLKGTYVDSLPSLVNARTGRIHTSFHQTVAGTGRLSSSDPNLQNIPIRSEVGRLIRRAFVADPGNHLIAADYSQIELRVLAHLSGDEVLLDAFTRGEDVHDRTAREMFGVAVGQVTAEMRRVAKAINYGLVYGQTDFGLARAVGIPREEARRYIEGYFQRYTGVARFMEQLIADAHREGGSRTLFGRYRPLPELEARNRAARLYAERMARNTPIQGTAADLLKLAMIAVQERLAQAAPLARMLLTVHDELVLEAPAAEAESVGELVKEVMEGVHTLRVPLVVEVGTGANWADC